MESTAEIKWLSADDKVVSEVNTYLSNASTITPLQKSLNKIAKLSVHLPHTKLNSQVLSSESEKALELETDSDGDLVLQRFQDTSHSKANSDETFIIIEYENSTTINLVGLQIWRGAFLLSDFVINFAEPYFRNKVVMELGSGTGLVGIVAAIFAKKVFLTDLNDTQIQSILRANVSHNQNHVKNCDIQIQALDFMDLTWSPQLTEDVTNSDVIIVADVVYHIDITDAFVRTIKKIIHTTRRLSFKDIFIAMEKRYVFTISDLDTCAPMYSHFLDQLDNQLNLSPGCLPRKVSIVPSSELNEETSPREENATLEISMKMLPLDFIQHFNYERVKELVLFHIHVQRPEIN